MITAFITSLVTTALALGSFLGFYEPKPPIPQGYSSIEEYIKVSAEEIIQAQLETKQFGAASNLAALATYNLSGAGVSSSATSFILTSFTLPQNDYAIQDADLGATFYVTFEPGNPDRQEISSCTTVGTNTGSTVTISGCTRGLSPITPFTASTTLQFSHGGGTKLVFSDPPQVFELFADRGAPDVISGEWTFEVAPHLTGSATSSNQAIDKAYADALAIAGAATSTETLGGIGELATAAEAGMGGCLSECRTDTTEQPLFLTASIASSSPTSGTQQIVVASTTGYIDPNYLATSTIDAPINFGQELTMGASTTANATSTFAGAFELVDSSGATSTCALQLGNHTASSTVWSFDGSGRCYNSRDSYLLLASTTDSVTSGSASSTLIAIPIEAGLVGDFAAVHLKSHLEWADGTIDGTENFVISLTFGGDNADNAGIFVASTSPSLFTSFSDLTNGSWEGDLDCVVIFSGSATQEGSCGIDFTAPDTLTTVRHFSLGFVDGATTFNTTSNTYYLQLEAQLSDSGMSITARNAFAQLIR